MADQTGTQPTADEEIKPAAEPTEEPVSATSSADGGDAPAEPVRATQPRFQIRAAINSLYNTPRTTTGPEVKEPEPITNPPAPAIDQAELERAAQVESLIAKGQRLARQGQLDPAREAFGEAVQLDGTNSEAWTWLGGLLMDTDLPRAHECLQRAIELDPTNQRAKRGLIQAEARLAATVPEERALALVDDTETEEDAPDESEETPEAEAAPARPDIKIGMEEAVESLRQSGIDATPDEIPLGGARIRPGIEKGELKLLKRRRYRRVTGYTLSLVILCIFLFITLAGVGAAVVPAVLQATANTTTPTATPIPTDTPVPLTNDEAFAVGLRVEIDQYSHFFATAHDLRDQVQHGKLMWEDYRSGVQALQGNIRNEKKNLDNLAHSVTTKLTPYYRQLESVAQSAESAIDFTVSGVQNTNPEDLEEGNREFLAASSQLVDLSRNLNQASPIPTPVPTATPMPTATPTASDTADTTSDANATAGTAVTPVITPSAPLTADTTSLTPGAATTTANTPVSTATDTTVSATPASTATDTTPVSTVTDTTASTSPVSTATDTTVPATPTPPTPTI